MVRFAKLPLSEQALLTLLDRLRGPKSYSQVVQDRFDHLPLMQSWPKVDAAALWEALLQLRALQDNQRLIRLIGLMDGAEDRRRLELQLLPLCAQLKEVRLTDEQAQLKGPAFGQALSQQRQRSVHEYLSGL
jgi:hypothetical protein